jgi:hypothetical protein
VPYFVVVSWQEKRSVVREGEAERVYTDVLPEAYDTLRAAEQAARQRAEREQPWPWSSVYVVEAANAGRAANMEEPNRYGRGRANTELAQAAFRDPERRVPEPVERLSAFQPPRTPPGRPQPSALPPAAFMARVVQHALDALAAANFDVVAKEHSAYFPDRPAHVPRPNSRERAIARVRELSETSEALDAQALVDLELPSLEDTVGVAQGWQLFERDGESDIGDLNVIEARTEADLEELLEFGRLLAEQQRRRIEQHIGRLPDRGDLRRSRHFRSGRVIFFLRLWAPEDEQFGAAVAALERVAGPPTSDF